MAAIQCACGHIYSAGGRLKEARFDTRDYCYVCEESKLGAELVTTQENKLSDVTDRQMIEYIYYHMTNDPAFEEHPLWMDLHTYVSPECRKNHPSWTKKFEESISKYFALEEK